MKPSQRESFVGVNPDQKLQAVNDFLSTLTEYEPDFIDQNTPFENIWAKLAKASLESPEKFVQDGWNQHGRLWIHTDFIDHAATNHQMDQSTVVELFQGYAEISRLGRMAHLRLYEQLLGDVEGARDIVDLAKSNNPKLGFYLSSTYPEMPIFLHPFPETDEHYQMYESYGLPYHLFRNSKAGQQIPHYYKAHTIGLGSSSSIFRGDGTYDAQDFPPRHHDWLSYMISTSESGGMDLKNRLQSGAIHEAFGHGALGMAFDAYVGLDPITNRITEAMAQIITPNSNNRFSNSPTQDPYSFDEAKDLLWTSDEEFSGSKYDGIPRRIKNLVFPSTALYTNLDKVKVWYGAWCELWKLLEKNPEIRSFDFRVREQRILYQILHTLLPNVDLSPRELLPATEQAIMNLHSCVGIS